LGVVFALYDKDENFFTQDEGHDFVANY